MEQITNLSGVDQFFSHKSDEWETPDRIFRLAERWWGTHTVDIAASDSNAKCADYVTKEDDALDLPWGSNNWCNPPFSLADEFVEKAIEEAHHGNFTTVLLKAAVEAKRFKALRVWGAEFVFLSPRVHYIGAGNSCPFPSCLVRVGRMKPQSMVNWYDFNKEEWY